jgi:hypothetical protein
MMAVVALRTRYTLLSFRPAWASTALNWASVRSCAFTKLSTIGSKKEIEKRSQHPPAAEEKKSDTDSDDPKGALAKEHEC